MGPHDILTRRRGGVLPPPRRPRPDTPPRFGAAPRATEHHCAGLCGEAIASADLADERVEAFQDAHHLRRCPFTVAARCRNALRVESFCDGSAPRSLHKPPSGCCASVAHQCLRYIIDVSRGTEPQASQASASAAQAEWHGPPAWRAGGVSYWRLGRRPSRLVPLPGVAVPGDLRICILLAPPLLLPVRRTRSPRFPLTCSWCCRPCAP
jgi:hypothetical protein